MATTLYINYVRSADVPGVRDVRHVYIWRDKVLCAKVMTGADTSEEVYYDFRNAAETLGSVSRPNGYSDFIYRYRIEGDTVHLWVAVGVPRDTPLPKPDYQVLETDVSADAGGLSIFLATGETIDTSQPHRGTHDWVPGALTDAEKKARAIAKIKAWREQKKAWLLEAAEYADLVPNIVTHLGYWLRSADYVLKVMYEAGVAGTLDWLLVEAIAKEAIKGPRTLDPDGDGAYNVVFFQRLKAAAVSFPTGPDFGALWVQTWDLTDVSDVDRVSDFTAEVIHSHGSSDPLLPDRTYHSLPSSYNSTSVYWSE